MSDTTTTAERLEEVRRLRGYSDLKSFWAKLREPFGGDEGYDISYDAARTYHLAEKPREPPAAYLSRVSKVFGVSLAWLIDGSGEPVPSMNTEDFVARLEAFTAEDFFAGVADGFGDGAARLLRGARRAMLAHLWRRLRYPAGAGVYFGLREVEVGRAIGKALRAPFESLGLNLRDLPDDSLTDYTIGVCGGLSHLSEITHKEETDATST